MNLCQIENSFITKFPSYEFMLRRVLQLRFKGTCWNTKFVSNGKFSWKLNFVVPFHHVCVESAAKNCFTACQYRMFETNY